jgi:hypothetical protein
MKTLKNMKKIDLLLPKSHEDFGTYPHPDLLVKGLDPDPRPDPYQNVTDPKH